MSGSFRYIRNQQPLSPSPPGHYYDNYLINSRRYVEDRGPFDLPYSAFEPRRRHFSGHRLIDDSAHSPRQPEPRDMDGLGGSRTGAPYFRVEETRISLSFGKAMKKLHRQLELAQTLYTDFQREYNDDVRKVRGYMNDQALVDVWVKKVASKNSASQDEYRDNSSDEPRLYKEIFAEQKTKVTQALEQVARSTVEEGGTSRKATVRFEATRRLRQKVETSRGQILQLLNKVTEAPEHCSALLEEFKYLSDLIDPENEKNAGLYTSTPDEEQEGVDAEAE